MDTNGWELYVRSGIYGFIFLFGITGNLFVMFFFGYKMKRAPNFRWFVVHLAIADCTYAIISPIKMLYLMLSDGEWHLGNFLCKLSYIGPTTINVSAFILCFMAYERYRAVCHPFKERLSKRLINAIVVGIWVLCILLKVPVMNRLVVVKNEVGKPICMIMSSDSLEHLLVVLSFIVFESVLPVSLLIIFFFRITFALKESESFRLDNDNSYGMERTKKRSDTPSYYSGLGAPPTPKWKPPLSPLPLVTLDECNADCTSLDYINFSQAHRRGRGVAESRDNEGGEGSLKAAEGIHFAFHRGRLYSGNSSCNDDVFESSPSHHDIPSSLTSSTDDNNGETALLRIEGQNGQNQNDHSLHNKGSFRNSYQQLKQYINQSNLRRKWSVARHFGIHNKRDRDIISALFLSVLMFALTSVPYNVNYFVITCIYLYSPDVYSIDQKHGKMLLLLNQWLGVLMLSGCIMNIIIYSGKFPQFRFQMYIWVSNICKNLTGNKPENDRQQPTSRTIVSISQNTTEMNPKVGCSTETHCRPEQRNENDYVKV